MPRRPSPLTVVLAAVLLAAALDAAQGPIEVRVVVVTMFELGDDIGDQPGEFQHWVEREALDQVVTFPQGWRDLRMNKNGVLGLCTGIGTAKAAASVMALGLDPRFDLRRAYWVVAGIAGIDQQRDGITAAESLAETKVGSYVAYLPAIDAAHRVASVVVRRLVDGWSQYRDRMPE